MNNFTTNTYEMKREILNFSKKLSINSDKVQKKFAMDMIYGISKSKNVLLSSISSNLDEKINTGYTIERLSNNLAKKLDSSIDDNYLDLAISNLDVSPVILVDDSDVVKPYGSKFECLSTVRDASSIKKNYEKGYHVTEMVGITKHQKQPISLFSKIHSPKEKDYVSSNAVTYQGLNRIISNLNTTGTFVFDRAYDRNELFKFMYNKEQNFVIRLTEKRKLWVKGKWYKSTTIRDRLKGKIKTKILIQGEEKDCSISVTKVRITADKRKLNLVLVYGIGNTPMMLATNLKIKSKEDLIYVLRTYMTRWKIEEYFRFKKQEYHFENFRVRGFTSINNLNKFLTYSIGLIAILSEKIHKNKLVHKIINNSNSLKEKVFFWFYQISRGIYNILKMAKTGIKEWMDIRKIKIYDGQISLL